MSAIELLTYKIENAICKTNGISLHAAAKQAWDANAKEQAWTKHVNVRNMIFLPSASVTRDENAKIRLKQTIKYRIIQFQLM